MHVDILCVTITKEHKVLFYNWHIICYDISVWTLWYSACQCKTAPVFIHLCYSDWHWWLQNWRISSLQHHSYSIITSHQWLHTGSITQYSISSAATDTLIIIIIITHISIAPWGPKIQRRLQQRRRTNSVWTGGFSSGAWMRERSRTVECQQVKSSRRMGLRQRKRVEPVRYVSVGRPAVEPQMSAESGSVRESVSGHWDTPELLWPAPCGSAEPLCRWPAVSVKASEVTGAAAWRRCDRRLILLFMCKRLKANCIITGRRRFRCRRYSTDCAVRRCCNGSWRCGRNGGLWDSCEWSCRFCRCAWHRQRCLLRCRGSTFSRYCRCRFRRLRLWASRRRSSCANCNTHVYKGNQV